MLSTGVHESEITVIDDLSTNAVSKNKEIYKEVNVIERNILDVTGEELEILI